MEEQELLRQPPYSLDGERSVLGSMLISAEALELGMEQLRDEDFYLPGHAAIFSAMQDLRRAGTAVDLVTLHDELSRFGKLDMAGGDVYLADLLDYVPSAANVQDYIDLVQEKSARRLLIKAGTDTLRDAGNESMEMEQVLNNAERRIYDISMRKSTDTMKKMEEVVPQAFAEIGELAGRKGRLTGIDTGFTMLNTMTNGLQKSDLIIVAARPAMGKTAFALNIAQHACLHDNRSVVIFSLEMSASQLASRMLCTEAAVDSQKIKEGRMDSDDEDRLMQVLEPMSRMKLFIDDSGNASVTDIRSKCRRLKARYGLDMIVIDYLQLMQAAPGSGRKSDNRMQEVSDMTRALKQLARELDIPIILLAQLNRGPETRTDHTPMISDLRESGSIEQDADMVLLLYRPQVYDETLDNRSQVIVAKHRHGSTGKVELAWQGEYTRFINLAPDQY